MRGKDSQKRWHLSQHLRIVGISQEKVWEKDRDERILWDEWLHALRPGELRESGTLREWLVAQCGWNGKFEGVWEDVRLETYATLDQHRSWMPNLGIWTSP